MSFFPDKEFLVRVAQGEVDGYSIIHKSGRNIAVGTTPVPVTIGGIYRTPVVGSATALRVKVGNTNDTASGSGAREVTLEGLDETGALVSEALATAGTSASSPTSATFIRLFRARVTKSGTYVTTAAGSHAADIVIENGGGGTDWATLRLGDYASSSTEIGAYSVPLNKTAYIVGMATYTDTAKITDITILYRTGILKTSAPFDAMVEVLNIRVEGGEDGIPLRSPLKVAGLSDFIVLAKVGATTAEVDVDFEILLVDD